MTRKRNDDKFKVDRDLAIEAVQVTEAAALAAAQLMGGGDEKAADVAALEAMWLSFKNIQINGTVCVGEKFEGDCSKLFVGDCVGTGKGVNVDVAIVPLEGKSILARGGPNALSLVAMAEGGGFIKFPDMYIEKIAVGPCLPDGVVDLDFSAEQNLNNLADVKHCSVNDLVVCLLDRPRNVELISKIRKVGSRIRLILDGDVTGVIQAAMPDSGVDAYMGIGGAQEGILAAAALRGVGGQMQGRLIIQRSEEEALAKACGVTDLKQKFLCENMAFGNVTFAATAVTYGPMLEGVRLTPQGVMTHSLVLRSETKTIRYIKSYHNLG